MFTRSFITGFTLGGLIGAALTLFFAPQPGKETLANLKTFALDYKDHLEETIIALRDDT